MKKFLLIVIICSLFTGYTQKSEFITEIDSSYIKQFFKPISQKDAKWIRTIEANFDIDKFNSYNYAELFNYYKYSIEVYYTEYSYTYRDSIIECSGLIALPKTKKAKGELLFCHGTILPSAEHTIPSYFKNYSQDSTLKFQNVGYAFLAASMGYITFIPDYIGYGTSKHILHPYAAYESNGANNIVFMDSFDDWIQTKIQSENQLIIMGISEGASIAMGTQRLLEKSPTSKTVRLNLLCAGPYDALGSTRWYINSETHPRLTNYAYSWSSYVIWDELNLDMTTLFRKPPKSESDLLAVKKLIFGTKRVDKIFSDQLITNIKMGDSATMKLLRDFSAYNFVPRGEVHLFHGQMDALVPFVNTQNALNFFSLSGSNVTKHLHAKLGHVSIVQPYIFESFKLISEL